MTIAQQLAKQLRDVYFGGNWTSVNMRDATADITWQESLISINGHHPIAELVFHVSYFLKAIREAIEQKPLSTKDSLSFDVPAIASSEDWNGLLKSIWEEVEITCKLIETLDDQALESAFVQPQYGTMFRNISGIIEHTHYHLGQIVWLKKDLRKESK
jgi:hypothetical protein